MESLALIISITATIFSVLASINLFKELSRKLQNEKREELLKNEKLAILKDRASEDFELKLREALRDLNEVSPSLESTDEISKNIEMLRQQIYALLREDNFEGTVMIIVDSKEQTRVIKLENLKTSEIDEIVRWLTHRYSKNIKQL